MILLVGIPNGVKTTTVQKVLNSTLKDFKFLFVVRCDYGVIDISKFGHRTMFIDADETFISAYNKIQNLPFKQKDLILCLERVIIFDVCTYPLIEKEREELMVRFTNLLDSFGVVYRIDTKDVNGHIRYKILIKPEYTFTEETVKTMSKKIREIKKVTQVVLE